MTKKEKADQVIEAVAMAMREKWHEIDPDSSGTLIPWEKSDKQQIWRDLAAVGILVYERSKGDET